jgi:arabinose-5-phosphate isomerase
MTSSPSCSSQTSSQEDSSIHIAKRVIADEIAGLQLLNAQLDESFTKAVELIMGLKGRLAVSGIGKSGHISRKIAATLASTGTPAFFVHASEASHGDLGMITPNDALLILSNSGNTHELRDMIYYSHRFTIPLIAIASNQDSALAQAAAVTMLLPNIAEASALAAPTTSTIMMLALGDALAVALQEKKGFTRSDFQNVHPGGRLGVAFKRVMDIMHCGDALPTIEPDATVTEVLAEMTEKTFGCTAVINQDNELLGIITDGDIRRHYSAHFANACAHVIMTTNPRTITPTSMAADALQKMQQHAITSLFVVEKKKLCGIIHIHDCLKAGVA